MENQKKRAISERRLFLEQRSIQRYNEINAAQAKENARIDLLELGRHELRLQEMMKEAAEKGQFRVELYVEPRYLTKLAEKFSDFHVTSYRDDLGRTSIIVAWDRIS